MHHGVPCLTLRSNTERPLTVNRLFLTLRVFAILRPDKQTAETTRTYKDSLLLRDSLELCSAVFHFTLRHHNAARVRVCVRRRCLTLVPGTDGRNIQVSTRIVIGRS
jgi:hypothetical protein